MQVNAQGVWHQLSHSQWGNKFLLKEKPTYMTMIAKRSGNATSHLVLNCWPVVDPYVRRAGSVCACVRACACACACARVCMCVCPCVPLCVPTETEGGINRYSHFVYNSSSSNLWLRCPVTSILEGLEMHTTYSYNPTPSG